ncbi:phosphoribose diphosphate--decaprenyl-phosphate phosphoribosyltransferase [Vibrio sp. 10N.261.46.E8]|uniref:decaprenyl-phosphate phosphoribosyltransferase n=2 Tax=unclassified Vibrio TaxID=2614977 RepID=UPI000977DEF1|nr:MULTISPECIES: decaprenyl-phosphate phosphoribosyltransferase [unclassified Vibrio]OMO32557.1 phosphoribose diphosphate--decaprenyl-phosphate phosphoribosyltransferase [Vibrio sp. 10N.261.45.E1]PMJ26035.1 phosphoribose diphosphate--decaprenyl-phosphate phosphoribosyltransferase [Vibrio sp. 10N.286.45.B6]PMM69680.1 phosphoribose diphosphate--decaprenyl-phosphate phosphoribosyltransferase [Vibrio sp. 10N.261.46.F12]PMN78674.1 phosphoribose diphosphate--decaprenyl-phosphate phosphoribosyltransfe
MSNLPPVIRLMRPKQWVKNAFVFAPLLFSGVFTDMLSVQHSLSAFVIFCLASSATYVLNDYNDIENDRKHPVKSKSRPLASGEVSKPQARILMVVLYGAVALSALVYPEVVAVVAAYLLLNVAYTFYLKHQPVLDIFTIATGFVLRVYAGAVSLDVPLSSWMFITTLSLALFLASIKRRQELMKSGNKARNVLQFYTIELVDKYAEMSATCAILFYSLFVISDKPDMVYTIPFVLFGLYRYWFIVESKDSGESPTDALFADRWLQLTILGWIAACIYSLTV